jgi:hypothetical protein
MSHKDDNLADAISKALIAALEPQEKAIERGRIEVAKKLADRLEEIKKLRRLQFDPQICLTNKFNSYFDDLKEINRKIMEGDEASKNPNKITSDTPAFGPLFKRFFRLGPRDFMFGGDRGGVPLKR